MISLTAVAATALVSSHSKFFFIFDAAATAHLHPPPHAFILIFFLVIFAPIYIYISNRYQRFVIEINYRGRLLGVNIDDMG